MPRKKANSAKNWDTETLDSYSGYYNDNYDSRPRRESHQANSAEERQQARNRLAELRGVSPQSIPYPRSNAQLSQYYDEIDDRSSYQTKYYDERNYIGLSHQAKSAENRQAARNEVANLRGVDPKSIPYPRSNSQLSEYYDEIDYAELPHQAKSAELRQQARNEVANLRGVDPKSIPYPRSSAKLTEYNDEIQYLEGIKQKFQKEYLFEKLTKELKEQEENLYSSLKKYVIEDFNIIKTITRTANKISDDNEEQNQRKLSSVETVDSDSSKATHCEQIIERSNVKTNQIKKDYSVSRSDLAIVDISYREDKEGKAAFWDHYTFQRITKYPTRVVGTINNASLLKDEINDKTYGLPISPAYPYKPTPPIIGLHPYSPNDLHGLLLIPGSHADSKNECPNYEDRMKNEECLLKDARNRGRPVLGICDGGLKIWKLFGGKEVKVYNHAYRPMPYLTKNGRVGHNTDMHHLRINLGSALADAMYGKEADKVVATYPVANSVHNKAMSSKIVPPNMKIVAWSIKRAEKAPSNRSPEENAIEAAETCHGAPMLLIQWHPEAYNSDDTDGKYHRSILTYMAKAGDAYCRRQEMLSELKKLCQSPKDLVKSIRGQGKKYNRFRKVDHSKVSENKKSYRIL